MGFWYVLQLLFSEISQNSDNSTTTEASEKNKHMFWILVIFLYVLLNLITIRFYLIKLAIDFYRQPSYLLGERASLTIGRMKIGRINKTNKFAKFVWQLMFAFQNLVSLQAVFCNLQTVVGNLQVAIGKLQVDNGKFQVVIGSWRVFLEKYKLFW